jgi:hypothetical protein
MKARPGQHIVLAPVIVDGPVRDGEILETRGPDGSEPFLIRWSDGHTGLLYPGPGSVLSLGAPRQEPPAADASGGEVATPHPAAAARPADSRRRVHDWQVRISIFDSDDDTDAHVVLLADSPTHLTASGHSHRGAKDYPVPEIGDEVAVARALRRLADQLLQTAAGDIEQLTGEHDVTLAPR